MKRTKTTRKQRFINVKDLVKFHYINFTTYIPRVEAEEMVQNGRAYPDLADNSFRELQNATR